MYGNDMGNGQQAYPIYPSTMQWEPYTQKYNPQPMFNNPVIGYTGRQGETSRISPTIQKVINDLIQVDLNSAYLYLAMSNYLNRIGFSGFGSFLRAQYTEELKF